MSSPTYKQMFDLQQKVYYIDKHVNTFFNRQIINIQLTMSQFNSRLSILENKLQINPTSNSTSNSTSNPTSHPTSNKQLQKNNPKSRKNNITSNIRTVNLG